MTVTPTVTPHASLTRLTQNLQSRMAARHGISHGTHARRQVTHPLKEKGAPEVSGVTAEYPWARAFRNPFAADFSRAGSQWAIGMSEELYKRRQFAEEYPELCKALQSFRSWTETGS